MRLPRVAGKVDAWLLIIVLTLLCIGIVMVYSASAFQAARYQGDASYYFQRELMWTILGMVAMLLTLRVDYRHWRRFSLVGMLIILPLLVIVLKFGVNVYGASRWLSLGSFFSFEPSELTKLVLALYIADWLARKGRPGRHISLWPGSIHYSGWDCSGPGVAGERFRNGNYYCRICNGNVLYSGS